MPRPLALVRTTGIGLRRKERFRALGSAPATTPFRARARRWSMPISRASGDRLMVARPAPFKHADVKRAVAGVRGAGLSVTQVEIYREGRIVVRVAGASDRPTDEAAAALDRWTAGHAPKA